MAAPCEFPRTDSNQCGVDAVGVCESCSKAFCRSHRTDDRRCVEHPVLPKKPHAPGEDLFAISYADDAHASDEAQAQILFHDFAKKFEKEGAISMQLPAMFRGVMRIGSGPLSLGSKSQVTGKHRPNCPEVDGLQWALIQEGIRVDLFGPDNGTYAQYLEMPLGDHLAAHSEDKPFHFFTRKHRVPSHTFGGWENDTSYWNRLFKALRSRRPSRELTLAYSQYGKLLKPWENGESRRRFLPATLSDLTEYVRSGARDDHESWFGARSQRLEPVTWARLARAMSDAQVPFHHLGILKEGRRNILGFKRHESIYGWYVESARVSQHTRLMPDGSRVSSESPTYRITMDYSAGSLTPEFVQKYIRSTWAASRDSAV